MERREAAIACGWRAGPAPWVAEGDERDLPDPIPTPCLLVLVEAETDVRVVCPVESPVLLFVDSTPFRSLPTDVVSGRAFSRSAISL